jgi:hypothetical protein
LFGLITFFFKLVQKFPYFLVCLTLEQHFTLGEFQTVQMLLRRKFTTLFISIFFRSLCYHKAEKCFITNTDTTKKILILWVSIAFENKNWQRSKVIDLLAIELELQSFSQLKSFYPQNSTKSSFWNKVEEKKIIQLARKSTLTLDEINSKTSLEV